MLFSARRRSLVVVVAEDAAMFRDVSKRLFGGELTAMIGETKPQLVILLVLVFPLLCFLLLASSSLLLPCWTFALSSDPVLTPQNSTMRTS